MMNGVSRTKNDFIKTGKDLVRWLKIYNEDLLEVLQDKTIPLQERTELCLVIDHSLLTTHPYIPNWWKEYQDFADFEFERYETINFATIMNTFYLGIYEEDRETFLETVFAEGVLKFNLDW